MKARQRKKNLYASIVPRRDCLGCFEWGDPLPFVVIDDVMPNARESELIDKEIAKLPECAVIRSGPFHYDPLMFGSFQ